MARYDGDNNNYVLNPEILLNKSSFTDVFKEQKGGFKYFVSGATADSFAYESLYLGNPSAYQTIIIGVNDICSSANDIDKYLGVTNNSTGEQIENFRQHARVNTYGETAPFEGGKVTNLLDAQQSTKEPYITFGVDRINVRPFIQ